MNLKSKISALQNNYEKYKNNKIGERTTESWFIEPFLDILGYDVREPKLVKPQYRIDPNAKNADKVDYAILKDGKPIIFVEGKPLDDDLDKYHSQLKKYFNLESNVNIGILTNGNEYQFYTDIKDKNQLDEEPFLTFCLEEIDDEIIELLPRFSVNEYNIVELKKLAIKIKHLSTLEKQLKDPDDEFIKAISKYIFGSQKKSNLDMTKEIILMLDSKLSKTPSNEHSAVYEPNSSGTNQTEEPEIIEKSNELFYIKSRNSDAKGIWDGNTFTILKDSIISEDTVPSYKRTDEMERIIREQTIKRQNHVILTSNINFSSPSGAASFCVGQHTSGWGRWKNKDGKTLNEIYRK